MSDNDTFEALSESEQASHEFAVTELKSVFRSQTNQGLARQFNEMFRKDDKGKVYQWTDIEEVKIREIFDSCKDKVLARLNEFRMVILPKNLTVLENGDSEQSKDSFEMNTFLSSKVKAGLMDKLARRSSLSHNRILSEEEINRVRDKFLEDIDFSYEEAIARHVSDFHYSD